MLIFPRVFHFYHCRVHHYTKKNCKQKYRFPSHWNVGRRQESEKKREKIFICRSNQILSGFDSSAFSNITTILGASGTIDWLRTRKHLYSILSIGNLSPEEKMRTNEPTNQPRKNQKKKKVKNVEQNE